MESLTDSAEILTKTCTKCGEEKLHVYFHKQKNGKFGIASTCKACNAAKMAEYRKTHRDYFCKLSASYRQRNPDAVRETNKNWLAKNPDYERERYKRRRQDPKQVEAMRAVNQRRKARHRAAVSLIDTLTTEQTLWLRAQCCSYCMGPAGELDHVVPLAMGGAHSVDNIVPACRKCNAQKSAKSLLHFLLARKLQKKEVIHGIY